MKKLEDRLKEYRQARPTVFEEEGFVRTLVLFQEMAERVPAYKDFLAKHSIEPAKIKTKSDFEQVPIMGKESYLTAYPLQDMCWDGKMDGLSVISSSSGSTGKSFMWPRGQEQEVEGEQYIEQLFADFFDIGQRRTLYINCFSMGTWVAGTYLLSSVERLSWKGYPIITVCPGIEKKLSLQLFQDLAGQFDQVIFGGYPPLVKDILDEGRQQGIDWEKHTIRFLFAAEGFSEQWRSHIHSLVGSTDAYATSINIFGSADATILGHETPLTNAIRQKLGRLPENLDKLVGSERMPTLVQYDPRLRYFEGHDGQLLFSARAGLPLVRYAIGDNGGCRSFDDMRQLNMELGFDWSKDLALKNKTWNLPFVWVFGRKNLATNLYGALIFPEYIKAGLEEKAVVNRVTGKFVMSTETDEGNDQFLGVMVEMAAGQDHNLELQELVTTKIVEALARQSSEYSALSKSIQDRAVPRIELVPYGSNLFQVGSKHRWVVKK